MKRVQLLFIAAALFGASVTQIVPLARAQVGVYDEAPQSLEQAARAHEGITIQGMVRHRAIPPTYTVRRGDTLWDVTGRFYGNPWEWPRVWSYNPEVTNPHWIYPHDQLRLLPPDGSNVAGVRSSIVTPVRAFRSGSVFLEQEGYLDEEALDQVGIIVGSPQDHMLLAPYDQVYVEFEDDIRERPAGEYTIYREIESDERVADEQGTLVRIMGAVRIETYDQDRHTSRATIIEALDPIERGFRVAPIPRRFEMVPPRVAERDLATTVAAVLRPHEIIGEQQVVFLPIGAEEGVEIGYRFFIVRAGDRWRDELSGSPDTMGTTVDAPDQPDEYPAEIVAEGRVVHVRPHSATMMITRSIHEIEIGDRAETRRGY
ncbi:MAG: LysM peptidoglycan-binding domain-containing protein [Sandaracinaceae bacterium]